MNDILTKENWHGVAHRLSLVKIDSKKKLDKFLRVVFGVYLASKPIDDGNSSPLDFIWDIYSTAKGINPAPCYDYMAQAARGSQKSLSGAVIQTLMLVQDGFRDWFHCAAIMDQSERTYSYVQKFFQEPALEGHVDGEPLMKKTKMKNGTYLQIGTGTIKSVSGFHGSVVMDEYDLMDRIVIKMAKGMLSAQQGHRPFMIYLSSIYFDTGNVADIEKEVGSKGKKDFRMHKWGILEMTERCPDEWSGPITDQIGWVNNEELTAISSSHFESLDEKVQSEYTPHTLYQNCLTCGIFSFCKGKLKNQHTREQNPFLEPLAETISKFHKYDAETFKTQRLNRKGSSKDQVYPMWNQSIHVKSISEMYELYTGEKCPEEDPSWEFLVQLFVDAPDCTFYFGADPGYTQAAAGLFVVDGLDRMFMIDEITESELSDSEFSLVIFKKWGHLPIHDGFPDQIPTFMKELKTPNNDQDPRKCKGALPASSRVDKSAGSVKDGISEVRKLLRVPGTVSDTRFFCLEKCRDFQYQMSHYRRKIDKKTDEPTDEIIKREDHHPDQFRYVVHTLFSKRKGYLRQAGEDTAKAKIEKIDVKKLPFDSKAAVRPPTPNELAATVGVVGFADNSSKNPNLPKDKKKSKLTFSI